MLVLYRKSIFELGWTPWISKEACVWMIQALCSAFFDSVYNGLSHSVGERWSIQAIAWWQRLSSCICVVVLSLILTGRGPSAPGAAFWLPAGFSILLNSITSLLYARALRASLSLTVPVTALSPVLLLISVPLMTGDSIPMLGMIGIVIIACGLYLLNVETLRTRGFLGPFKSVWSEKGSRLMLIVIVCWAVTAPLDRLASQAWHPFWFAASLHGGTCLLLTPAWLRARRHHSNNGEWKLAGLGPVTGAALMLQMTAIVSAPVAFVIALRRFSAPLSSIWGRIFFHEPNFRTRILGAVIMTAGGAVMLLSL